MLDFLNLKEEGEMLILFTVLAGILGGIAYGLIMASGGERKDLPRKIFGWIFAVLAVPACGLALVAGFIQLITFRWGQLLKSAIIGGGLGIGLFCLFGNILFMMRRRRFLRNGLMQEILHYCKTNNIVGIQCFPDRARFFTALENEEYCRSEQKRSHVQNAKDAADYENTDMRPGSWKAYDNPPSLVGILKFSDRDYPEVPDVSLFATALAQGLGGCGVASHGTSVHYTYRRHNVSTGQTEWVKHTTHTYQDHFVYKKKALKALKQEKAQADKEFAARRKAGEKKSNHWN